MNMTTSWAFASAAVVAILVAGCTTEVTDSSEGGVSTGASGSAAGAAGSGGGSSTGGGGGTGGSSDTDAGPEVMSVCETCAYAKCKTEADACEADKDGCGAEVDKFYTCISKSGADETACALTFAEQSNNSDAGGSLANDLAGCMVDTMGCLETCQGGGTSDAGAHE